MSCGGPPPAAVVESRQHPRGEASPAVRHEVEQEPRREGGPARPADARVDGPAAAAGSAAGAGPSRGDLPGRRRTLVRRLLLGLLPLALAGGFWLYVTGGAVVSTDDAYVDAEKVGVATDISGIVREVDVTENQHVARGQVLYRLRDRPYRLALENAQAQIGIVRDEIEAQKARYRDMQAQIAQARNDDAYYQTELEREQRLMRSHVASEAALDGALRNQRNAGQKINALQDQLAALAADLGGDPSLPVEQHPRYRAALSQRDEAQRQLDHTVVRAPFAGIVTDVPAIAPGKYLQAAATAFYLVSTDRVWIDSEPKETQLAHVRVGQAATVTADAYPDARWNGVVESISPVTAQEFSLLPAQNSSGNWVKVVQRLVVRVSLDPNQPGPGGRPQPPLRAGMSVEVGIRTGHPRGLPRFLAGLFGDKRQPG